VKDVSMRIGLAGAGRIGSMHAGVLAALEPVETVVVADVDPARAAAVAGAVGGEACGRVDALFDLGLDALVVASSTDSHAGLVIAAVAAGLPVFCEKPVAADLEGTLKVVSAVEGSDIPVQVGFQRRFDAGYLAARELVARGDLGFVHTLRSCTLDPAPPPADYVASSGGIFRDCALHDIDSIRWITGREVVSAYAVGSNQGAGFFAEVGDVATASAVLSLDDLSTGLVTCSRYNGAGYDVRLEVLGERGSVVAGLDDRTPMRSTEPGATTPGGTPWVAFAERFAPAYVAELRAFLALVAQPGPSPCTPLDALEAFYVVEACDLSRREERPVAVAEVRR
jgi:myo-inositol 2-dehydrogenase/D-chiro-inositol 1-dehydrogenase